MADVNEDEWREALFASLVDAPEIEEQALRVARTLGGANDPQVQMADVTGARRYLRTCVHRMSIEEAQVLTGEQAADLWARGALGAARYRAGLVAPEGRRTAKGR
jgi:hypothetical protein